MGQRHDKEPVASASAPTSGELAALADAMQAVTALVTDGAGFTPLDELVRTAVAHVPGATAASVTMLRDGRFSTVASTGDPAARADALQHEVGSGPSVDAVLDDAVYRSDDVRSGRWSAWGVRTHDETGITSALSYRLTVLVHCETVAALNIYSEHPGSFDETSESTGLLVATHGSLLVTALLARDRAENVRRALESNREIGVAMGVLMQRHRLTREQSFDVLRVASQDANRKLGDIATEVADTGILAIRRWPSRTPSQDDRATVVGGSTAMT